ncbi:hypothetical protein RYX36_007411 [Vicia faba]
MLQTFFSPSTPLLPPSFFPYLVDLQPSHECLICKLLIQIIEEIGFRAAEHSPTRISSLLILWRGDDVTIVKQCIISGIHLFCSFFEEMILQFQQRGKVESYPEKLATEGVSHAVNISWLVDSHPVLDPTVLMTKPFSINGASSNFPVLESELTAMEKMIAVIGALIDEGERGAKSLEILISQIHPDLLADIVVANMKHLPKTPLTLARFENRSVTRPIGSQVSQSQVIITYALTNYVQSLGVSSKAQFPLTCSITSRKLKTSALHSPT